MKLDKLNIHLKNVIFFKAVLYVVVVLVLLSMMPLIQKSLSEANIKKERSMRHLENVKLKLDAAKEYKFGSKQAAQDLADYLKYSKLESCFDRMQFIKRLNELKDSDNGINIDELNVRVHANREGVVYRNIDEDLVLNDYEIDIFVLLDSPEDFIRFGHMLHAIMPKGTIVTYMDSSDITSLSPEIIDKLNLKERPSLFDVRMKLLLKEITYENGVKPSLRRGSRAIQ